MTKLHWGLLQDEMDGQTQPLPIESSILASLPGLDSSKWILEMRTCDHKGGHIAGLEELFENPVDPNVFFSPAFFSASIDRVGRMPKYFLITWEELGEEKIPRLALPITTDKVGLPSRNVWRVASNPYAPLSTPVLHPENHETTVPRFIELLEQAKGMNPQTLLFEDLDVGSQFYQDISFSKFADLRDKFTFLESSRAVLNSHITAIEFEQYAMTAKRRRELRRQTRRLKELGDLKIEKVTAPRDILLRFEEFLLLETRGWKGQKKTAINDIKRIAAFARQAICNLAEANQCALYSLRLDGKAIASLVMLRSQDQYYPWKIAYSEDYGSYAPGMMLFWKASRDLVETDGFGSADSLAVANNKLTNSIWKDEMKLGYLVLPFGTSKTRELTRVLKAIERKDYLKQQAKKILAQWHNRKMG